MSETEKNKGGRPSKYDPIYCEEILTYFNELEEFPTLAGFAVSIDAHKDTLNEWGSVHDEFSVAIKKAKGIQEGRLVTGAMANSYNTAFSIFFAKNNLGYKDKTETEHSGNVTVNNTMYGTPDGSDSTT